MINDENMRKKYHGNLLLKGFKTEFIKSLKNIYNAENDKLSFFHFIIKHLFIIIIGMAPTIVNFIKTRHFELDTFIGSILAILLLLFCIWCVSKLQLK